MICTFIHLCKRLLYKLFSHYTNSNRMHLLCAICNTNKSIYFHTFLSKECTLSISPSMFTLFCFPEKCHIKIFLLLLNQHMYFVIPWWSFETCWKCYVRRRAVFIPPSGNIHTVYTENDKENSIDTLYFSCFEYIMMCHIFYFLSPSAVVNVIKVNLKISSCIGRWLQVQSA